MLLIGEIRTTLLRHEPALSIDGARQLLDLVPGRTVLHTQRPESRAISPKMTMGIDCRLTPKGRPYSRGIGIVTYQASIVGGTVAQASAFAQLRQSEKGKRLPWAHYVANGSVVEFFGAAGEPEVCAGFLERDPDTSMLNLGELCANLLTTLRSRPPIPNNRAVLRTSVTPVRWTLKVNVNESPKCDVRVRGDGVRTLAMTVPAGDDVEMARRFCVDFALHDWLIQALEDAARLAERRRGQADQYTEVLGAAMERLAPLWSPGAHLRDDRYDWWESLEKRAGLSRQWALQVAQIRDKLAVQTLREVHAVRHK